MDHIYTITDHIYTITDHIYTITDHTYIITDHIYTITDHIYTITVPVVNFHSLEAVYACVLFLSTNSVTASRKTSAEGAFDNKLVSCLNIVLMSSELLSITAPV